MKRRDEYLLLGHFERLQNYGWVTIPNLLLGRATEKIVSPLGKRRFLEGIMTHIGIDLGDVGAVGDPSNPLDSIFLVLKSKIRILDENIIPYSVSPRSEIEHSN